MQEILSLFNYSAQAVAAVMLVALVGVILVRLRVMEKKDFKPLGQLVFYAALPCLLFTQVAATIDLDTLARLWILPVSCFLFIGGGMLIGILLVKVVKPAEDMKRGVIAACAFSNAGYLPIPLIAAVTSIFPVFRDTENSGALGIAYISAFLIFYSPLTWTVGFSLISGRKLRQTSIKNIINPPVVGMLLGVLAGITPPVRSMLLESGTWSNSFFKAAQTLGLGAIPCVLIILGASLAHGPERSAIRKRVLAGAVAAKLVLMPLFGLLYVFLLRYFELYEVNLVMAVVLVVEATSPPANNLAVMCNLSNQQIESRMAAILFWAYLFSIPALTFFILLAIQIFQ